MNVTNILSIIQRSKEINLETSGKFEKILDFLHTFEENYVEILEGYNASTVRFCDYYEGEFSYDRLIGYFNNNYKGKDYDEQQNYFILYSIFKKCEFLIIALEEFGMEDALESFSDDVHDVFNLIETFSKSYLNSAEEEYGLGFDSHKYKLLFSGYSLEDVKFIDKKTTKTLVNKINNILLEMDMVPGAESVSHVKEKFNVPLLRIQLAEDYRIAFIRRTGVTIIIGVELKSGKDIDYARYDKVARRIETVYLECDLLNGGELPDDAMHYKVIEEIERKLKIDKMTR